MRSFIAIELPDTVKSALLSLQQELKTCGADIRWVKTEGIHLTLKFLGNIEDKLVDRIIEILKGTCRKYRAFNCEIRGVGVFPHVKSPRVLWVGVGNAEPLTKIQQEIENGMSSLGFERENRKYSPHLTLGRFKSSQGRTALLDKVESHKNSLLGSVDVNNISLMRSDLSPAGAKYTNIAKISLGDVDA